MQWRYMSGDMEQSASCSWYSLHHSTVIMVKNYHNLEESHGCDCPHVSQPEPVYVPLGKCLKDYLYLSTSYFPSSIGHSHGQQCMHASTPGTLRYLFKAPML